MIVALYKAFNGHEWVEASLESVYSHMNKIVFLNSMVNWKNEPGNTVKDIVYKWKAKNDFNNKIDIIEYDNSSQLKQYEYGVEYIKKHFPNAWTFMVDCDEIWDFERLQSLIKQAEKTPHNTILTSMFTYIKTPFFRVHPEELLHPVVIVKDVNTIKGIRGCDSPDKFILNKIKFHHFTYVRWDESDIIEKIKLSRDGENSQSVCLEWWEREKWNKLPAAKNFHPHPVYQHSWQGVRIVQEEDLPIAVRGTPIINRYKTKNMP